MATGRGRCGKAFAWERPSRKKICSASADNAAAERPIFSPCGAAEPGRQRVCTAGDWGEGVLRTHPAILGLMPRSWSSYEWATKKPLRSGGTR